MNGHSARGLDGFLLHLAVAPESIATMKKVSANLAFAISLFLCILSALAIFFMFEAHQLGQLQGVSFHTFAVRTKTLITLTIFFFLAGLNLRPKRLG